jgi:cytochrome c oxidase cbb3-type subunit III
MRSYFRYFAAGAATLAAMLTGLCWSPGLTAASAAGSQSQAPSSFNSGQARMLEDPAAVAHGKTLYGVHCQACHGSDLRGGDMGGPNLLRSQVALSDQHGELIIPIIQGSRMAQGMPNLGLNNEDAGAVAAYVRSVIGTIGRQGAPPGQEKVLNILVGDASRGQAYFAAHCASCHSSTGDLKGIASTYTEPSQLQARWITGGVSNTQEASASKATVDVTTARGHKVSGALVHVDDFMVTLKLSDGMERTFLRNGGVPVVVVHDPMEAHRDMLPRYTDHDIHDLTAYLVTLK